MKKYQAYLIDLDGTMYRGTERIEAASDFIKKLNEKKLPHLFVTNNSSRRPEQVADKLNHMDIPVAKEQVYTTSMATAQYIKDQHPGAKVYAIGEEGLLTALKESGLELVDEGADFVVIGIDRGITYEKLASACMNVRNGAVFLSTNGDVAIPTERGMLPGNGSLTSVITVSTGVEPIFIGKPEPIIMEQAMQTLGYDKKEVLMVGDNYHTDIKAGMNASLDTLMVFTGVTSKEDLEAYEEQPTYTIDSLEDWFSHL
ncbi:TIGR01457 family HAD-type hydrolase [Thalassobacillus sp. B23F22_16]|uniref:TIGR01457 family HAD-type hydrolase n=1 Tax=Thalassobacillus sp. B23F22_16 TaxID=3459513 RepID=UPI00373E613F